MSAVRSASASPGLNIAGVNHDMYTRGSCTVSVTVSRFSAVIGGVVA